MNLTQNATISPEVLAQQVGGETVLLDLQGEQYFGLNEVGTRVWELLATGKSLQQILDTLLDEYDAPPDQLKSDLEGIISELVEAGLITLGSNG